MTVALPRHAMMRLPMCRVAEKALTPCHFYGQSQCEKRVFMNTVAFGASSKRRWKNRSQTSGIREQPLLPALFRIRTSTFAKTVAW